MLKTGTGLGTRLLHITSPWKEKSKKLRDYVNNMFEESDDDGNLLQHHRPSGSKCFLSFIKHARTDKTGITSLKSGDLVSTDPSAKQNCQINNSRVFLPNWSDEGFTHCRGSIKSDVQPPLSSTHGANRHRWPRRSPSTCVKRTKLCDCCSFVWHFPSSPTVWWHGAVGLEAGLCDNNVQERV